MADPVEEPLENPLKNLAAGLAAAVAAGVTEAVGITEAVGVTEAGALEGVSAGSADGGADDCTAGSLVRSSTTPTIARLRNGTTTRAPGTSTSSSASGTA